MMNDATVQKRLESLCRCWYDKDYVPSTPNFNDYLYRAAYADGVRAGMERSAKIADDLCHENGDYIAGQIRQAVGEDAGLAEPADPKPAEKPAEPKPEPRPAEAQVETRDDYRATITQQAQEIARLKDKWAARRANLIEHYEGGITRLEAELEEYRSIAEHVGAEKAVSAREAAKQQVARLRGCGQSIASFFVENHENAGEELYGKINGMELREPAKQLNMLLADMTLALRETAD